MAFDNSVIVTLRDRPSTARASLRLDPTTLELRSETDIPTLLGHPVDRVVTVNYYRAPGLFSCDKGSDCYHTVDDREQCFGEISWNIVWEGHGVASHCVQGSSTLQTGTSPDALHHTFVLDDGFQAARIWLINSQVALTIFDR